MAMIIPISTNTTIAPCIQIQVGDIYRQRVAVAWRDGPHSALRKRAASVNTRIFTSSPSDQWAM
jgi:hypothetical protein